MPRPSAEIICIGTELLLGEIVDTDGAYLSRRLSEIGIDVFHRQIAGDNPSRLAAAIRLAAGRSRIVFLVGGLGPTYDDITRETLAEVLERKLIPSGEAAEDIRAYFAKLGREMTENNLRQALCPEGGEHIRNPHGTAPGIRIEADGVLYILMPGVPREMIRMTDDEVLPDLRRRFGIAPLHSRTLRFLGIGESLLEHRLGDQIRSSADPTVAPYCKEGEVTLRVTARGSEAEANKKIDAMTAKIRARVGEYLYTSSYASLFETAVRRFEKAGLTFTCAESCTGGLIAEKITDISGASVPFKGGFVTYTEEFKEKFLGVRRETLLTHTAVSEACAKEMARGARSAAKADYAVSVTGYAGPGGGDEKNPVGTVYFAVAGPNGCICERRQFPGTREVVRTRACKNAIGLLLTAAGLFREENGKNP